MYQGVNSALLAYGKLTRMTFKTIWHNNGNGIGSMYEGIDWALLAYGMLVMSQQWQWYVLSEGEVCRNLKETGHYSVGGGVHPTA
jgi:hypothetical protein